MSVTIRTETQRRALVAALRARIREIGKDAAEYAELQITLDELEAMSRDFVLFYREDDAWHPGSLGPSSEDQICELARQMHGFGKAVAVFKLHLLVEPTSPFPSQED